MKRFVIAPDSFKGTMDASTVCEVIGGAIRRHIPDADIKSVPLADGGEGMVDTHVRLLGGKKISAVVSDLYEQPLGVEYGLLADGSAVMEMAGCAGLMLIRGEPDPLHASTRGVGELLLHASNRGLHKILMGIGGSATNDCGLGMAAALGYRFYNGEGGEVAPYACNLGLIEHIEKPAQLPPLQISVACDVANPLCGENGATYVFGRQKGVKEQQLAALDQAMAHFAAVIERELGSSVGDLKGAGAAGGLGAALVAFVGARLESGIDLILNAIDFDAMLADADLVITGEGRIDGQSITGKVPVGVGLRAKRANVPCLALCGSVGANADLVYDYGITAVYAAVMGAASFEEIRKTCVKDLEFLADSVVRTLMMGRGDTIQDNRLLQNK